MGLLDEYEAELARLKARYGGAKLVLLYMVGSFYEMYASVDDPVRDPTGLYAVAELLNIAITRKSKAVPEVSRSNPLLAGIPVAALAKYRPVLLNADYTVAIANQRPLGATGGFVRVVEEVLSPGTWDGENAGDGAGRGTLLAVAWVEVRSGWTGVGVAGVDLSTGGGYFAETHAAGLDAERAIDEARSMLRAARPRELVVVGWKKEGLLGADAGCTLVHADWQPPPEMGRVAYQEAVLGKAFPEERRGLLTALEHLGMERAPLAAAAYATALEFAYQHDERVLSRLLPPEPWHDEAGGGTMAIHSAEQLNLVGGPKALLPMLNGCKTAFGRRAFAARLLRPSTDVATIERRLDAVDALLLPLSESDAIDKSVKGARRRCDAVRAALAGVQDMERLARRVALGRALPHELAALADSAGRATEALMLMNASWNGDEDEKDGVAAGSALRAAFEGWNMEALRRGDLGTAALDTSDPESVAAAAARDATGAEVARLAEATEAKDEGGGVLTTTRRRFDAAVKAGRCDAAHACEESLAGSKAGGRVRLAHPAIDRHDAATRALQGRNRATLEGLVGRLAGMAAAVRALVRAAGELDVAAAAADAAARWKYCRPTFAAGKRGGVRASGLRHPIVERLLTAEAYTANDVDLGAPRGRGMLVYGLNAAGKTTYMKAVGCAVIMAQAGFFVAADVLELRPFDAVHTRIGSSDDLYEGRSTFVVEMLELRNILRRATESSLVLGDELCAGTESVSAIAIVAQGVATLVERGCCFILATHLHELVATSRVRALLAATSGDDDDDGKKVQVTHLHVEVEADGTLVYHRLLRPGHGDTLYGLEVSRALGMGDAFAAGADAVRRELLGVPAHVVQPRQSRYNARVFVDECFVCGSAAGEVHHLRERATADADGFVGNHHMNAAFNLVAVCEKCHAAQHRRGEGASASASPKRVLKTSRGRKIV